MKATPTHPDRWEVTATSNTLLSSFYFVVCVSSKEAVKVSISNRNRRHYVWQDLTRAREKVPGAVRREIDRALVRFLSVEK